MLTYLKNLFTKKKKQEPPTKVVSSRTIRTTSISPTSVYSGDFQPIDAATVAAIAICTEDSYIPNVFEPCSIADVIEPSSSCDTYSSYTSSESYTPCSNVDYSSSSDTSYSSCDTNNY